MESTSRRSCWNSFVEMIKMRLPSSPRSICLSLATLLFLSSWNRMSGAGRQISEFGGELEPWTTVEVTQPGVSDEEKKVRTVLLALVGALAEVAGQFSLQVILRREPSDQKLLVLRDRLPELCGMAGP